LAQVITRIARIAVRYPKQVLIAWAGIVVVFGVIAIPVESKLLPADLFIPGTQSYKWQQLEKPEYGLAMADAIEGPANEIDRYGPRLGAALARRPLTRVQDPWSPGAGAQATKFLRRRPDEAVYALDVRIPKGGTSSSVVPPLERFINARLGPHMRSYLSGDAPLGRELNDAGFDALHEGELIAAPLLVLILFVVFRSPVATAIPLAIAGGTVAFSYGMLRIFASFIGLDIMALSLASMMGLALGIDYALLFVSRFREALDAGRPPRQAATLAANTAGRTAMFAGTVLSTLMIAVIILSPGSLLRSASIGAIFSTVFAMASSLFVCPAMLTLLGARVNKWQLGGRGGGRPGVISRVVRRVIGRPLLALVLVMIPLLLLASPVLALKTTPPDPNQLPPGNPALIAYKQIRRAGLGPNISIILRKPDGGAITSRADLTAISQFEQELREIPYVAGVAGPGVIAPKAQLLANAPAQLAGVNRELVSAHKLLNQKIDQVQAAQSELANDRTLLSNGLTSAQAELSQGQAELANAGAGIGQLGELADGLGVAASGATDLANGTSTVQSGATKLTAALQQMHDAVNKALPQILAADKEIRTAQSEFGLLQVPAQVVQQQLEDANSDLSQATIGNADPEVQKAKLSVAAALAADTGSSPIPGVPGIPGYTGLANSLAQAESEASSAGDEADYAVRQVTYLDDALNQSQFGAGRIASPGLSTIIAGLRALSQGLTDAHDKVAAEEPQVASLAQNASAALSSGQAQLQSAGSEALPQMQQAQVQLSGADSQLRQLRHALVSKTGPFKPLREVEQAIHQSPFMFSSPYMIVAVLQGTRPLTRYTVDTVVDSATGGNVGQIVILPDVPTNSPQQDQVVGNVRALLAQFARQHHFLAAAGGSAAELVDYKNVMASRVPLIILVLCLVTYLMLVPILRSVVLPAIAVVLNVLTVTVAMGIVTCASVNGVIAKHAPIGGAGRPDIVAITAVFCVIFALSIDYYVFLLTRMREEYVRTQSNRQAVQFGIERTGRIVTGAAAIMVGTFFAFSLTNFTVVKELGIGLTSAILVDATLVRLVLLPAVMRLCGDWTWFIPDWLDARLPAIDIEGAAFEHESASLGAGSLQGAPGFA
jgi:putative drug exporter of the RND superfamily